MAFGRHWEWRGFGTIGRELRAAVESLPTKFPAAQELVDEYLWVPGSAINVKLRTGDLKFKRLVARSGRLERWLEDPEENYALPIAPPVVQKLAEELRIRLPSVPASSLDRQGLIDLLARAEPHVVVVSVKKRRWQHEATSASGGTPATVELAEILEPEVIGSIGIEHPSQAPLEDVLDRLELPGALKQRNYLDALALWAAARPGGSEER